MSFTALTGGGVGGAYQPGDKWGAQTAEKVRTNFNDHETRVVSLETATAGASIAGLTDVGLTSPLSDGELLTYDSGSGLWINAAPALPTNIAAIYRSVTSLTNAQTLALPTAEITLTNMTTPGAGLIFLPIGGAILTKTASGAYTNINADAWLRVRYSGGDSFLSYVPNDTASPGITNGSATRVSDLLGTTSPKRVVLVPQQDTEDVDDWGPLGAIMGSSADNNAVVISIDNNGSGDFTGGHVSNVVRVLVYYTIEAIP